MKKSNIINLIRYHVEGNDSAFANEAIQISKMFDDMGDQELASYVMSLISNVNSFVPQNNIYNFEYFYEIELSSDNLVFPTAITKDINGILNAVSVDSGVHKFLFTGSPGTGKTECVKHIARILERKLFQVNYSLLVDSRLGETSKNISAMFKEINSYPYPDDAIFFFDEIDSVVLDRINSNDVREMGRAASLFIKELDSLTENYVLFGTTNLYEKLDKALVRRFDAVVDFNRYKNEDLLSIAEMLLNKQLKKVKIQNRDVRLFRKIIGNLESIPYPGELKNIINTAVAFSDKNTDLDYLKRLYDTLYPDSETLTNKNSGHYNYTIRDLSILSGKSKSSIGRNLKDSDE